LILPWDPWKTVQEPILIGSREPEIIKPELLLEDTIVIDTRDSETTKPDSGEDSLSLGGLTSPKETPE
jgi:hypothetical protein